MSVTAIGLALDVGGISPRAKLILLAIANCANEYTFEGYPGRKELAHVAGCSVDTVDRCVRELIDVGFLEKTERQRDDNSRILTSNLYRIFPSHTPSRKNAATPQNAEGGGRKNAATLAATVRPPWPHSCAATVAAKGAATKEPSIEPSIEDCIVSRGPVSKPEIEALIARAGDACDATAPGVHHGADLNRFIRGGCDLDADIGPAVDQLAASFRRRGKRFATWSLLEENAVQNRDRRLAGIPAPSKPPEQTNGRAVQSVERDAWDRVLAEVEGDAARRPKPPVALGG